MTSAERHPAYRTGVLALALALAAILGALGSQYIGGLDPCPLCLEQRYAYYAGVPLLFVALVLLASEMPRPAALLFAAVALAFLANAGLAAYHAGVEWGFWAGPDTCSNTLKPLGGGSLLNDLGKTRVIRCDVAAWRFLGISLAGWNVGACLVVAILGASSAFSALRRS